MRISCDLRVNSQRGKTSTPGDFALPKFALMKFALMNVLQVIPNGPVVLMSRRLAPRLPAVAGVHTHPFCLSGAAFC